MFPIYLNPTPSHLLTENDKWMLDVCDAGVGTVPRMHEVVTLENLEDFHIATVLHPRGIWDELRVLYGESFYINGHYEISLTGEEDEGEDEEESDDAYSDGFAGVTYVEGAPQLRLSRTTNILNQTDLRNIKRAFSQHPGVRYHLPNPQESAINFDRRYCFLVFLDHFRYGLRFPLLRFFCDIFRGYGLLLYLLTPESIGYMVCFLMRFWDAGMPPTFTAFRCCFELCMEGWGFYFFRPRPGFYICTIFQPPIVWRRKFILVSSVDQDWNRIQPPQAIRSLDPLTPNLLTPSKRRMIAILSDGALEVPRFQEIVTLESIEHHGITRMHHPGKNLSDFCKFYILL
ncbi:hypothetical protein Dimus_039294 [Dionaea muscipula]